MAKGKKKKKQAASAASRPAQAAKPEAQATGLKAGSKLDIRNAQKVPLSRRNVLRAMAASVVLLGGGIAIHRHDVQARERHDLSTVGTGMPTVVQIHDPSCPLCRRLMSATRTTMKDFPGVVYRIADITTNEGRAFQTRYDVPNVTLLLFDAEGKLLQSLNGVRNPEELRQVFASAFDTPTAA